MIIITSTLGILVVYQPAICLSSCEVFCKINSHLGDVDNDPHTPKSNGSLKSSDKKTKIKNIPNPSTLIYM